MRVPFPKTAVRVLLGLAVLAASGLVLLSSEDVPVYTTADKAYYMDAETLNYIRPGLKLTILNASIGNDGTIQVRFKLTDPKDVPLDKAGIDTAGAITTTWVAAYIPEGQTKYVDYTVNQVVSTLPGNGGKATQAGYDSGSRNAANYQKVGDGEYVFTFNTKAPLNFNRFATHTIGGWASRDLSEFEITTWQNQDSKVFTWVPAGTPVAKTRDVIRTQSCNRCHGSGPGVAGPGIHAHDNRRGIELCILCHQPQTSDPDTGQNLDLAVMVHKIHMGENLPSVKAGGKYSIVGYRNIEHDFSTVALPTEPNNCTVCHEQTTGAAQATAYLTNPSRTACGACHDDVNFATGEGHFDQAQANDENCSKCHWPASDDEFDVSVPGAHTLAGRSKELPGVVFDLQEIRDARPGSTPTIVLKVTDKAGNPITKLSFLNVVRAGPTVDYSAYISESMASTPIGADGTLTYTMKNAIPADATGSFAFGIEGRRDITIKAGTRKEQVVRDVGRNVVKYAALDGGTARPRRTVVAREKCNFCHDQLALHGSNRTDIEQCVLCHNPNGVDSPFRPAEQAPSQTIDFAYMIHRIHTGESSDREYTIYGYHGSVNDFREVRYPADRRDCSTCHVNGSEVPPLQEGLLNVSSPRGLLNPVGPTTNACTGCHTETYSASHALTQTSALGEACAACHAANYAFGVPKMHAR